MDETTISHTHPEHDDDPRRSLRDRGASIVEYALLVALIAVVCLGAVTFFGESTGSSIDRSGQSMFNVE